MMCAAAGSSNEGTHGTVALHRLTVECHAPLCVLRSTADANYEMYAEVHVPTMCERPDDLRKGCLFPGARFVASDSNPGPSLRL